MSASTLPWRFPSIALPFEAEMGAIVRFRFRGFTARDFLVRAVALCFARAGLRIWRLTGRRATFFFPDRTGAFFICFFFAIAIVIYRCAANRLPCEDAVSQSVLPF